MPRSAKTSLSVSTAATRSPASDSGGSGMSHHELADRLTGGLLLPLMLSFEIGSLWGSRKQDRPSSEGRSNCPHPLLRRGYAKANSLLGDDRRVTWKTKGTDGHNAATLAIGDSESVGKVYEGKEGKEGKGASHQNWLGQTSLEAPIPMAPWPVPEPPAASRQEWVDWGNGPQTEAELAALRTCARRGQPFCDRAWVQATAFRLDLGSTLRPRGRPPQRGLSDQRPR